MSDIRNEELSALIDGALDPARAGQVRAAIAADPGLRADYEALARLDKALHHAGEAAQFTPDIDLPRPAAASRRFRDWSAPAAIAAALLLVRLAPKFIDMAALGWALQAVAAGAILMLVVKMASEREDAVMETA